MQRGTRNYEQVCLLLLISDSRPLPVRDVIAGQGPLGICFSLDRCKTEALSFSHLCKGCCTDGEGGLLAGGVA